MNQLRTSLVLGGLCGALVFAQPAPPPRGGDFTFLHARMGMEKVVKGAPYTAQAVTQFSQTLADGSHIQRSNTASVARDSEGRTRREITLGAIGSMTASDQAAKPVFIHDPVAGLNTTLEPSNKTARQSQARAFTPHPADPNNPESAMRSNVRHERSAARSAQFATEDLGTQTMEGVTVQGKRITRTIAAGQIGNEKALQVVTEIWYSPDLQTIVMSKTDDPRNGETVYKLTNISRSEPDAALFQVPSDYKVTQGGGGPRHMRGPIEKQ